MGVQKNNGVLLFDNSDGLSVNNNKGSSVIVELEVTGDLAG